jgi:hypothetical protein
LLLSVDRAKIAVETAARRRTCTDRRQEVVMTDPHEPRRVGDVAGAISGVKAVPREPFRAGATPSRQAS